MELWIIATVWAAFFQTLRFMLQKVLATGTLSATGATFARFVYAQPAAWAVLAAYLAATGASFPRIGAAFWGWGLFGGLGQILATVFVVLLFKERNFAVGITLKKTEVIQTAVLGLVLLGEVVTIGGWIAIGIGLMGVLLLSETPGSVGALWQRMGTRAVALGLASGFFFAISGVGYRAATLEVAAADPFLRALVTLSFVNLLQSMVMIPWMLAREPGQIGAVWGARRVALWLGLTSMAGSLGWFTAFTQQTAAYVFALGQVELIFSLAASVLFFRERVTRRELLGIAVLTVSIMAVALVG